MVGVVLARLRVGRADLSRVLLIVVTRAQSPVSSVSVVSTAVPVVAIQGSVLFTNHSVDEEFSVAAEATVLGCGDISEGSLSYAWTLAGGAAIPGAMTVADPRVLRVAANSLTVGTSYTFVVTVTSSTSGVVPATASVTIGLVTNPALNAVIAGPQHLATTSASAIQLDASGSTDPAGLVTSLAGAISWVCRDVTGASAASCATTAGPTLALASAPEVTIPAGTLVADRVYEFDAVFSAPDGRVSTATQVLAVQAATAQLALAVTTSVSKAGGIITPLAQGVPSGSSLIVKPVVTSSTTNVPFTVQYTVTAGVMDLTRGQVVSNQLVIPAAAVTQNPVTLQVTTTSTATPAVTLTTLVVLDTSLGAPVSGSLQTEPEGGTAIALSAPDWSVPAAQLPLRYLFLYALGDQTSQSLDWWLGSEQGSTAVPLVESNSPVAKFPDIPQGTQPGVITLAVVVLAKNGAGTLATRTQVVQPKSVDDPQALVTSAASELEAAERLIDAVHIEQAYATVAAAVESLNVIATASSATVADKEAAKETRAKALDMVVGLRNYTDLSDPQLGRRTLAMLSSVTAVPGTLTPENATNVVDLVQACVPPLTGSPVRMLAASAQLAVQTLDSVVANAQEAGSVASGDGEREVGLVSRVALSSLAGRVPGEKAVTITTANVALDAQRLPASDVNGAEVSTGGSAVTMPDLTTQLGTQDWADIQVVVWKQNPHAANDGDAAADVAKPATNMVTIDVTNEGAVHCWGVCVALLPPTCWFVPQLARKSRSRAWIRPINWCSTWPSTEVRLG